LSKLGVEVAMLGAMGTDSDSQAYMAFLNESRIKTHLIDQSYDKSGMAFIEVDASGENKIMTIGGANYMLSSQWIDQHLKEILEYDVFMFSLEIPKEVVEHLLLILKQEEKIIILDPAPVQNFTIDMTQYIDYLTPNETEYDKIGIISNKDLSIILKQGNKGSTYLKENLSVQGFTVDTIDTVGAGDTFNAALCYGIIHKMSNQELLTFANAAGALATTKVGAQCGMPTLNEIKMLMKNG